MTQLPLISHSFMTIISTVAQQDSLQEQAVRHLDDLASCVQGWDSALIPTHQMVGWLKQQLQAAADTFAEAYGIEAETALMKLLITKEVVVQLQGDTTPAAFLEWHRHMSATLAEPIQLRPQPTFLHRRRRSHPIQMRHRSTSKG